MKIYRHEKGIIMSGRAWEVREKLKEYGKIYPTLQEWIQAELTIEQRPCQLVKQKPGDTNN
ncbi:Z-ring formation inhibitor MciZ [Bacillus weihaiensis]|uniref:Z-ring formation inhibitor MciZ n=1 Tax=Bacillus weihaiensis TaxID=1547283 RepID=A0A1L3MXD2_9BACI|nr:Z-ring formation inhibitor MciZ [Bacillus weihaiensis]APH06994.1 hypothetical protein A9C19_07060 [Bacillus weihaiensis]